MPAPPLRRCAPNCGFLCLEGLPCSCFAFFLPLTDRVLTVPSPSLCLMAIPTAEPYCSFFVCCGLFRCQRSHLSGFVPTGPRPQGNAPMRYFDLPLCGSLGFLARSLKPEPRRFLLLPVEHPLNLLYTSLSCLPPPPPWLPQHSGLTLPRASRRRSPTASRSSWPPPSPSWTSVPGCLSRASP